MAKQSRRGARRVLLQALYQMQLTGHSAEELAAQFAEDPAAAGADMEYFSGLLKLVADTHEELDKSIARYGDIPAEQLDPIEHAILWIGMAELRDGSDVPPKVVINEAIELAKAFGAEGGFRYVNGLLDRASADLR
jgi:transcription antitermination protein NusB